MNHLQGIIEHNLLQAVINAVPAPIFYKDAGGRYLGGNKAFENYIGLNLSEFVGKTVCELFDSEQASVYQAADDALMEEGGSQFYEARVKYNDGRLRDVEFHKAIFHAELEHVSGIVGVILDITERKRVQLQYEHLAFTDTLTSLGSRLSFQRDLAKAYLKAARTDVPLALILLDLDNFKTINDTYGHPVGDAFLVAVSKKLTQVIRKTDAVARIGGDEFAIVIEDVDDIAVVKTIAENLRKSLSSDISCCGLTLPLSMSIGVALKNDDSPTVDDLMKNADIALYLAKGAGKNTVRWFQADAFEE